MSNMLDRIKKASGRITRTIDLGDFEESYRGATFEVCVTPSRAHLRAWGEITEFIQEINQTKSDLSEEERVAALASFEDQQLAWMVTSWVNVTLDEAREVRSHLQENNPLAWDWLLTKTSATIGNFRAETLKN